MGHDGVPAVNNGRVVPAFVEHTHIHTQNIGEVNRALHSTLIRADDHQVLVVDLKVVNGSTQCLQELIGGHKIVKS